MPALENKQHEAFARYRAQGLNGAKAAIAAGYSQRSAKNQAYKLHEQPEIAARIAELAADQAALNDTIDALASAPVDVATREGQIAELTLILAKEKAGSNHEGARKTLRQIADLQGLITTKQEIVTTHVNALEHLGGAEMAALISFARQRLEALQQPKLVEAVVIDAEPAQIGSPDEAQR